MKRQNPKVEEVYGLSNPPEAEASEWQVADNG